MTRIVIWFVCAAGVTAVAAESASAQPPAPGAPRPAFSPFLNLTRQGVSPGIAYYGLVRPELQYNQSIQNLQGAVGLNQQAIGDIQGGGLATTGHPTQFLNYGGYFLNNGAPDRWSGLRPGHTDRWSGLRHGHAAHSSPGWADGPSGPPGGNGRSNLWEPNDDGPKRNGPEYSGPFRFGWGDRSARAAGQNLSGSQPRLRVRSPSVSDRTHIGGFSQTRYGLTRPGFPTILAVPRARWERNDLVQWEREFHTVFWATFDDEL